MHLNPLVRLCRRIMSFLFPVAGWASRVKRYGRGQIVWPIAAHPELGPMGPWPAEWTVVEFARTEDGKTSLRFHDTCSDVSGREAKGEDAVRCARCGIHLHVAETDMETNLDIPLCPWCVGFVRQG